MAVARPQVSIRLGTTGRSDVEKDFAAIGDSGEAQAKRYQAAWERASAERRSRAGQASQGRCAPGIDQRDPGPAPDQPGHRRQHHRQRHWRRQGVSGRVHRSWTPAEASAKRLLAAVDPLYAAQMRYDQALAEANALQRQGLLVGDRLRQGHDRAEDPAERPGRDAGPYRRQERHRAPGADGVHARHSRVGRRARRRRPAGAGLRHAPGHAVAGGATRRRQLGQGRRVPFRRLGHGADRRRRASPRRCSRSCSRWATRSTT
jgi:hypothetical protein